MREQGGSSIGRWAKIAAGCGLLLLGFLAFGPLSGDSRERFADGIAAVVPLLTVFLCFPKREVPFRVRRIGFLAAASNIALSLGFLLNFLHGQDDRRHLISVNLAYFAAYPAWMAILLLWPAAAGHQRRLRQMADGCIMATALTAILWPSTLAPLVTGTPDRSVVSVVLAVMDILILHGMVMLMSRGVPKGLETASWLMVAGSGCYVIADFVHLFTAGEVIRHAGEGLGILWPVGATVTNFAVATYFEWAASTKSRVAGGTRFDALKSLPTILALAAAVAASLGAIVVREPLVLKGMVVAMGLLSLSLLVRHVALKPALPLLFAVGEEGPPSRAIPLSGQWPALERAIEEAHGIGYPLSVILLQRANGGQIDEDSEHVLVRVCDLVLGSNCPMGIHDERTVVAIAAHVNGVQARKLMLRCLDLAEAAGYSVIGARAEMQEAGEAAPTLLQRATGQLEEATLSPRNQNGGVNLETEVARYRETIEAALSGKSRDAGANAVHALAAISGDPTATLKRIKDSDRRIQVLLSYVVATETSVKLDGRVLGLATALWSVDPSRDRSSAYQRIESLRIPATLLKELDAPGTELDRDILRYVLEGPLLHHRMDPQRLAVFLCEDDRFRLPSVSQFSA